MFRCNSKKIRIEKYFSFGFPIQDSFKHVDVLSSLLSNSTLGNRLRKLLETNFELDMNDTQHVLDNADYINLRANMRAIEGMQCL